MDFFFFIKIFIETPVINSYMYDQLLDQVKSYILQDCYSRRKTSVGVAEELGITQSKASRLIRKYCAKEE